ncbi:MAG: hypothetical protein NTW38_07155 [Candidatus Aminicenantes bacterium]|nr:hypothetical protein [Candidatus Aminicenantes bacterium]
MKIIKLIMLIAYVVLVAPLLPADVGERQWPFALTVEVGHSGGCRWSGGNFLGVGLQYRFKGKWGLEIVVANYEDDTYHVKYDMDEQLRLTLQRRWGVHLLRILPIGKRFSFCIDGGLNLFQIKETTLGYSEISPGTWGLSYLIGNKSYTEWSLGLACEIRVLETMAIRLRAIGLTNAFMQAGNEFDSHLSLSAGVLCRF